VNTFRLEQWGQDYVVIPHRCPNFCPRCHAPYTGFRVEFIDQRFDRVDLDAWTRDKVQVEVAIICYNEDVVCETSAEVKRWEEVQPKDTESQEIGEIRKLYDRMKEAKFAVPYPSTELLEKTFLPGKLHKPDIWIADSAVVDESATLKGPLLIGAGSRIEAGATCGPYAGVIDSVIRADMDFITACFMYENRIVSSAQFSDTKDKLLHLAEMIKPSQPPIKEGFPVEIKWADDPDLQFRFNYGTRYAIAINRSIPANETLQERLVECLHESGCLDEVVFEYFSSYGLRDPLTLEIGMNVAIPVMKSIIRACLGLVSFPLYVAMLTNDYAQGTVYGYTQRTYFGSLSPEPGNLVSQETAQAFVAHGRSIQELVDGK
jgi:hypothetical protein